MNSTDRPLWTGFIRNLSRQPKNKSALLLELALLVGVEKDERFAVAKLAFFRRDRLPLTDAGEILLGELDRGVLIGRHHVKMQGAGFALDPGIEDFDRVG